MQTITPELQAILKSKFEAAASGFRSRVTIGDPRSTSELEDYSASAATITAAQGTAYDTGDYTGGPTPVTVTNAMTPPDPDQPYMALFFWVGRRTDTGAAILDGTHTIGNYTAIGTTRDGWSGEAGDIGMFGYYACAAGESPPDFIAQYVPNWADFVGGNSTLRGIGVLIQTGYTAPVQTVTIDDSAWGVEPTEGNLLIAAYMAEDAPGIVVNGWSTLERVSMAVGFGGTDIALFAKVATSGMGTALNPPAASSFSHWTMMVELQLSHLVATTFPPLVVDNPKRISIDKSLRLDTDAAEVEFANEALALGWGPDSLFQTNLRYIIEQWYGDEVNAVRTFTGLIDRIHDSRDVLTTTITGRDLMALLVDQTFSASGPQGADEDGAIRTEENGVYLNREVSYIVTDLLTRAGWPTVDLDITATSYVLDEFRLDDGSSYASAIIGDEKLTGLVGYSAWSDEFGVFHFAPTLVSQNFTDPTVPAYTFRAGEDIVSLDDETDQYDLRTRIKVRGPLTTTTLTDTWRELWRTSKITKPVGLWYRPSEPGNIRVISRSTKRLYVIRQSDRAITASVYLGSAIPAPLGLSGDPSDDTIYWVLNAPWIYTGSTAGNSVKKVRAIDNVVLASYAIPNGRWSALKVSASWLYLTNLDTDRFYRRSKTDASAVADYQHVVNSVTQTNPSGIMVDGTTLYLFWSNGGTTARFLACHESDPATPTATIRTTGTELHGGEMDTTTHTECYGDADDLNLVAKFTLVAAVDQTSEVSTEVVDIDLEDELGFNAGTELRVHDAHPDDPAHAFETRRMTLDLSVITSLAQATETAQRQLDLVSKRRRVLDAGIIGNPAIQKTDYVAIVDPITGISTGFAVDTYRTEMSGDGTYLGTLALLPVEDVTDTPTDEGDATEEGS